MSKKDQDKYFRELMELSQNGDESSYHELLTAIYPLINGFLKKKYGPFVSSEDMTQESLVAIHKARHTYDSNKPFKPWMFGVVRYKSIDFMRKKQKQWQREQLDDEKVATFRDDSSNSSIEGKFEDVHVAIRSLPEEMRRAITLTKIEGLDTKEAAEIEGVSPVAIRSRISRAYKILRKRLEREIAG